jgi:hypothetical protein
MTIKHDKSTNIKDQIENLESELQILLNMPKEDLLPKHYLDIEAIKGQLNNLRRYLNK